jgi:hypothetical protein
MGIIEELVKEFTDLQETWADAGACDSEPSRAFAYRISLWLRDEASRDNAKRDILARENTWELYEDPQDWKVNLELTMKFIEVATKISQQPQDKIIQAAIYYGWSID